MVTKQNNDKQKTRMQHKAIVGKSVGDYGNDPFFVKKANKSQKFLKKHGFPEHPTKK